MFQLNSKHNLVFLGLLLFCFFPSISCCQNIYVFLGNAEKYIADGKMDAAIDEYNKAIKTDPEFIDTYILLGDLYRNQLKNYEKAMGVYENGQKHNSDNGILLSRIMYLSFQVGDVDKGLLLYEKLSGLNGGVNYSFPVNSLDKIINSLSIDDQKAYIENLLSKNRTDVILIEKLSDLYIRSKEYSKALPLLESVVDNEKTVQSTVLYNLGTCYYNLGDFKKSLLFFEKAKKAGAHVPNEVLQIVQQKIGS
jgi:tetratricopeptide (TPR) repeat protein